MNRRKRARIPLWSVLVAAPLLSIALVACLLDRQGPDRPPPGARFDAIVVLGCRVVEGGAPSYALRRRARHAAQLYHQGVAPFIVTTGGVGDFAPSEADAAAEVLLDAGVPRSAILREDRSTSTEENASHASARFGGRRVLVVTDTFHTWRSERVFARRYDEVVAVGTRSVWRGERARGALREALAIAAYLALDRIDFDERPARGVALDPAPADRARYLKPDLDHHALADGPRGFANQRKSALIGVDEAG